MKVTLPDFNTLARWVKVIGFLLILGWGIWQTSVATIERSQNEDLIGVLSRRSPITEYQAAEAAHSDCRSNYEDAFLARVGFAITTDRTDQRQAQNATEIQRLTAILGSIEANCPTPVPPVFDENGKLLTEPVIPSTTTSTSVPLPTVPAPAG